ncbi:MAG: Stp1/IreP family PP2C-type Ser/Thr phosphatase [Elusimicrobiales bacterium]
MTFEYFGMTDKGLVREKNEDSYIIDDSINFAAVADGMGGHKGGEIASKMAVNITYERLIYYLKENLKPEIIAKNYTKETSLLLSAVNYANAQIFTKAQTSDIKGMGTTLTSVFVNGSLASFVHIGDSRAYLIRGKEIVQITDDDSFVMEQYRLGNITLEEAEKSPFKNILTKALGTKRDNSYFIKEEKIFTQDIILLSTDGLTRMLTDREILNTITKINDLKKAAERLVEMANQMGGEDNITLILIRVS